MRRDVVVIGGGAAGLAAALAATDHGADVELLERTSVAGGAALLSNGSLWTFDTIDSYLDHCPGADPHLAGRVVSSFDAIVARLRNLGADVAERGQSLYGAERSHQVAPRQLVSTLSAAVRRAATVVLDEPMSTIGREGQGLTVTTVGGRRIDAETVVLATGGIHADPRLLKAAGLDHYVGLPVRNRPESGDGVRVGTALGGEIAGTHDGIYGHLVPAGLAGSLVDSSLAAQYQSWAGVLIGTDGAVLASPHTDDHHLNRILARQPGRRGVLIYDSAAAPPRIRSAVGGTSWATDRFEFARAHGARTARGDSVEDLEAAVAGWGVGMRSSAARAAEETVLHHRPFFAVEVEPSMTHAGAGLRVDRSLQAAGVTGAYAAGQDIGGGFGDGYGGGLAFALTTGAAAGRAAATQVRRPTTTSTAEVR